MMQGKIISKGFYRDLTPMLAIITDKNNCEIPYRDSERISVSMNIDNNIYTVGIRTTARLSFITICPNIIDSEGREIRLADILLESGFFKQQVIAITYEDNHLKITAI